MKKVREALPILVISLILAIACVWQFAVAVDGNGSANLQAHYRSK